MKWIVVTLMPVLLIGCSHTKTHDARWIDPSMAVQLTAAAGPQKGVEGVFAMRVRAIGQDRGELYLNSEADYRDPRNLSVAVSASAQAQLQEQLGDDPARWLKNRPILVRGIARTVRIDFTVDGGQPSGKYYYQTQIRVQDAAQLQLR